MAELYSLPDGWEWKTLSDIFNIERGGSPRPIKDYITYDEDGINWIKISDATKGDGKYIESTEQKIKPSGLKNTRLVVDGDFIMSNSMSFGKPYIVKTKGAIHDGWLLMREKIEKTDKDFFYYLLSSNYMYEQFSSKASGTTVKNLNIDMVKTTNIPLPSFEEQKRIVAKLDILFKKIDKAIALHQKNCEEADIFMASVLNDVFVELEEKYEKKQLNQIVIFGGKNISTLEYPNLIYFSLEDIETQTGKILNYKTVNESGVKGTAVSFDDNVVLYSKLRPYLNKVIVPNLEGCATTELVVLKPKDKLDKYFLASYLRSSNIVSFLNNDSMGAKMPRTNMKTFRNLDIPLPPLQTQQKVVSYLDEISNKMEKIKQIQKEKMQSLKELKASILDKAFKGEL
ncbi:restriction endonuclease subunit S [Aliarcobacter cryaerophilus]|uniref:Type I restriction endonuclease n=1 Tax=Aliarcobacter cryaerophilus TaxID=28198 RepID=A0A2S9SP66_9BACT|nr:restriction endonuclease subunit S [Aliarcobacter cryaerophilus]PRM88384.1 type I restriction endonuclease [Aliarcobacter cryaerophilus]